MLTKESIYQQIDADQIDPIQEIVSVDYDNNLQLPIGFSYQGHYHEIIEIIGTFHEKPDALAPLYLVRTRDGVYALYLDMWKSNDNTNLWRSQWVLHWRLREDNATMLVDMKLKQLADFHGHLCPELVIGYRAVQIAMDHLELDLLWSPSLCVIAENTTSAVDAIQKLTNCTLGNGQLRVRDYGKHVYTFIINRNDGLCLTLRPEVSILLPNIIPLENKIQSSQASLQEIARYQVLLDKRVEILLSFSDNDLFSTQQVIVEWPDQLVTSALYPCAICGELVAETHLVDSGEKRVCRPCIERKRTISD